MAVGAGKVLHHRGPDSLGKGYYKDYAFIHNRLKITNVSGSKQPHYSDDCILMFNGEIYNYKELNKKYSLNLHGEFGDTDIIIPLYKKIGAQAFNKFSGMFAILIIDEKNDQIILTRDTFGIKPLFVANKDNNIYVSSEIKGIISAFDGFDSNIEMTTLKGYCLEGKLCDSKKTFFKGIESFEAGTLSEYNLSGHELKKISFCDKEKVKSNKSYEMDLSEVVEAVDSLLKSSMQEHLQSEVKQCLLYSSGLDSRLVNRYVEELGDVAEKYTYSFENTQYDEAKLAIELGDQLDQVLPIGDYNELIFNKLRN